jgi:hypothetical protein
MPDSRPKISFAPLAFQSFFSFDVKTAADNIGAFRVTAADMRNALAGGTPDCEGALPASWEKRLKVGHAVTRGAKGFALSRVPAIAPQDFLVKDFS